MMEAIRTLSSNGNWCSVVVVFLAPTGAQREAIAMSYISASVHVGYWSWSVIFRRCLFCQLRKIVSPGLFPPSDGDYMRWSEELAWQPVPVHTVPQTEDFLLNADHTACPRLTRLKQDLEQGEYMRGLMEDKE